MSQILINKYYNEPSIFLPENLLREARRQKNKKECNVPAICLLDPDGDLANYLIIKKRAVKNECWACYHSSLYSFELGSTHWHPTVYCWIILCGSCSRAIICFGLHDIDQCNISRHNHSVGKSKKVCVNF
jgi:hypothetical protein